MGEHVAVSVQLDQLYPVTQVIQLNSAMLSKVRGPHIEHTCINLFVVCTVWG